MKKITTRVIEVLRAVTGKDRPFTSAVIVAAGSGTRMGKGKGGTKQLLPICGVPVAIRSMLEFDKSDYIDEIVLVAREEERETFKGLALAYGIKKLSAIARGGESRQESVLRGFSKISPKSGFVAVHDAARCLVTADMIAAVVSTAYACGGAAAGCKVHDTAKIADLSGTIADTVDRERLWLAQTPQVFKSDLYRAAAYTAREDGFEATDDCALVERLGAVVRLVDCGPENIKITTPRDMDYAEFILELREKKTEDALTENNSEGDI